MIEMLFTLNSDTSKQVVNALPAVPRIGDEVSIPNFAEDVAVQRVIWFTDPFASDAPRYINVVLDA